MADDGRWNATRPLTYLERRERDQAAPLSQPFKKAGTTTAPDNRNRFQGSAGWFEGSSNPIQKPK
jgi:hypothetical protein